MKVQIINQQTEFRIPRADLTRFVQDLTAKIIRLNKANNISKVIISNFKLMNINLVFVTKRQIKFLNANFRGKNKETDILSFKAFELDCFGELVFCPKVILGNATRADWPIKYEYLYMLTHGYLHLLGFDHQLDKDEKKMIGFQNELFNKIIKNKKYVVKDLN